MSEAVFLLHTMDEERGESVVAGADSAAAQHRPLYGVCLRSWEILTFTDKVGTGGLMTGGRQRTATVAPRCHCLLARAPIFDVLFAILRRFLEDEEVYRLRLLQENGTRLCVHMQNVTELKQCL